jgi:DNA-binding CsgD family transcriptional regulator
VPTASRAAQLFGLGELVSELGHSAFPQHLFLEMRKLCGCAHFVALSSAGPQPIKVLLAANEGAAPLARMTAEKYIAHYWRYDPVNAVLPKLGSADVSAHTTPEDIGPSRYRNDCYSVPQLIERFSLLRCRHRVTTRIHVYRDKAAGRFSNSEIAAVRDVSSLLFALIAKHSEISDRAGASESEIRRRISMLAPDMPKREADVCVGIVSGRTSEAIALNLNISINTVLTYRKRAYARLSISSQNELLRLVG